MKILHTVESYLPAKHGMSEVVSRISEYLVKRGHEVSVATSYNPQRHENVLNGVSIIPFKTSGNSVRGLEGETEKYQNFLLDSDYDIITNFAAQQWATDLALPILGELKAKKVFVPTGFSALYNPNYQDYFANMKDYMKQYEMNIFLSNDYRDINFAKKNGAQNCMLIPNGASSEEFLAQKSIDIRKKLQIPNRHYLVLHVGGFTGVKGQLEAIAIFQKSKLRFATLLLVGNYHEEYEKKVWERCSERSQNYNRSWNSLFTQRKIKVVSLSRQETVEAFRSADIFLFPSSIECSPIVLFECMASKTPFLSTAAGNASEILEWAGQSGLIMPSRADQIGYLQADTDEGSKILTQMYQQKKLFQAKAKAAFEIWKTTFTWEKIAQEYEKLYIQLLSSKN